MRRLIVALVLAAGCTRATSSSDGTVVLPPPGPSASAAVSGATSAPARPPPPSADLAVIGGDLVDLVTVAPIHALTTDLVFSSAVGEDVAYTWVRSASGNELRAYEIKNGVLRWAKPVATCWTIAATRHGAICGEDTGARFYAARTGDAKAAGAASAVASVVSLGGRVLVLHRTNELDAFDDAGVLVGSAVVPVPPDGGYLRSALAPAGAFACGTRRSDASTDAFCVDATPRVVWRKTLPVPGGILRQADAGALVVASDTWAKVLASEVLRPSDGATLLHVTNVRLGAALTTGGALDGALASEPDVVLFDAKGVVKWTWHPTGFRDEALRAVRVGPNLALALYNPIATGTQLVVLDAATGTLAWTANVDQLMISHSKYSNQVELRTTSMGLLLLGHESMQDFAQRFDPATGVRAASVLRKR